MQAPDLAATMYEPMPWSRHSETGSLPYFLVAPFQDTGGVPRISFIPWYIRQSQTHSEAPRLTSEQVAALNLAEQILHDPALHITMEFRPGDVQFLNNATILHSREAYTDFDDPTLRRHLLRLWLTTDNTGPERLLPHL